MIIEVEKLTNLSQIEIISKFLNDRKHKIINGYSQDFLYSIINKRYRGKVGNISLSIDISGIDIINNEVKCYFFRSDKFKIHTESLYNLIYDYQIDLNNPIGISTKFKLESENL